MRILYASYTKRDRKGDWLRAQAFLSALRKLHDEVFVYMPRGNKDYYDEDSGITDGKSLFQRFPIGEIRKIAAAFFRWIIRDFKELRRVDPDVVFFKKNGYLSLLLLCVVKRIPVILDIHAPYLVEEGFYSHPGHRWIQRFWQWVELKAFFFCSHAIVVSEEIRRYYIGLGVPETKITAVPNGVDIQRFHPAVDKTAIREELDLIGKTVIGFSGAIAPWHGLDFFFGSMKKYFERNPDEKEKVKILLVGQGDTSFIHEFLPAEQFIVTGHISQEKLPQYIAAMDIFVLPYPPMKWFYFSPLKLYEAMAMGKAVIASGQGQILDVIEDGKNGILFRPGDERQFIHRLGIVIHDENMMNSLGRNAWKSVKNWLTWEDNGRSVLSVCRRYSL